jgi:hypothetical protein
MEHLDVSFRIWKHSCVLYFGGVLLSLSVFHEFHNTDRLCPIRLDHTFEKGNRLFGVYPELRARVECCNVEQEFADDLVMLLVSKKSVDARNDALPWNEKLTRRNVRFLTWIMSS